MDHIHVTFADGNSVDVSPGIRVVELAASAGAKNLIAAKVDGQPVDLNRILEKDCTVDWIAPDSADGLEVIRHSTAHLMAQAVKSLFPGTQVTIGPTIDDGFYYDFKRSQPFSPEELEQIEKRMQELAKANLKVVREECLRTEASEMFRKMGEDYKVEIIEGIKEETVSLYRQGDWVDLCRGPHVPSTGAIKAFKLTGVAGAYWRGNEHNEMLQRIYGTSWHSKEALNEHLRLLEEAKKRDHRKLGQELGLFM
ncbi:MAG: TGS domain-containing protein, partial [Candidatus Binatia bacterium]